jgi:hypothetical protein
VIARFEHLTQINGGEFAATMRADEILLLRASSLNCLTRHRLGVTPRAS